jgi:hypothetical protein
MGEKIWEVPISYNPRSAAEGKKIRWSDGLMAIWTLFRYRIEPRHWFTAADNSVTGNEESPILETSS